MTTGAASKEIVQNFNQLAKAFDNQFWFLRPIFNFTL